MDVCFLVQSNQTRFSVVRRTKRSGDVDNLKTRFARAFCLHTLRNSQCNTVTSRWMSCGTFLAQTFWNFQKTCLSLMRQHNVIGNEQMKHCFFTFLQLNTRKIFTCVVVLHKLSIQYCFDFCPFNSFKLAGFHASHRFRRAYVGKVCITQNTWKFIDIFS